MHASSREVGVIGESGEPTVVRGNRFIDVYHAVQINGGAVHVLDNEISVRDPERVPATRYPGDAINVLPFSSLLDLLRSPTEDHTSCTGNVIARNRIDGCPDGVRIIVLDPQSSCRRNTIRDNTIIVGRTLRGPPPGGAAGCAANERGPGGHRLRVPQRAGADRSPHPRLLEEVDVREQQRPTSPTDR